MKRHSRSVLDPTWLIRLRWISALVQIALLALSMTLLQFALPFLELCTVVGVLVLSNAALHIAQHRQVVISQLTIGSVLILDTLLLYSLLFLTGGPSNPFSILFVVHVALAAVVLGPRWTWLLALVASSCFAALFVWYQPFPAIGHHGDSFSFHLYGMLIAFVLTVLLVAYFVSKVARELQEKEQALRAIEREQMNQQRLSSLATLAAGAAHELATPLSTIAVAAGELADELEDQPENKNDIELIRTQVKRCRAVLDQMAASGGQLVAEPPAAVSAAMVVEETLQALLPSQRGRISTELLARSPLYLPRTGLQQCLSALVKNALDASSASSAISISTSESDETVEFEVKDAGQGISALVQERVGEPFFTTKEPGAGMGLGIYLAKNFVHQYGGQLAIESREGLGTTVKMAFPKEHRQTSI